jgi:hypothetical protein
MIKSDPINTMAAQRAKTLPNISLITFIFFGVYEHGSPSTGTILFQCYNKQNLFCLVLRDYMAAQDTSFFDATHTVTPLDRPGHGLSVNAALGNDRVLTAHSKVYTENNLARKQK